MSPFSIVLVIAAECFRTEVSVLWQNLLQLAPSKSDIIE